MNQQLFQAVDEAVERKLAHLIDFVIRGDRGRQVLEVYVDTVEGTTTELCAEISREVAVAIENSGLVQGPYRLDVSSPGIERPLKFPWQYRKHLGRRLQAKRGALKGDQVVTGKLILVNDEGIQLEGGSAGEPVALPFDDIVESRVLAPW